MWHGIGHFEHAYECESNPNARVLRAPLLPYRISRTPKPAFTQVSRFGGPETLTGCEAGTVEGLCSSQAVCMWHSPH